VRESNLWFGVVTRETLAVVVDDLLGQILAVEACTFVASNNDWDVVIFCWILIYNLRSIVFSVESFDGERA